MAEEISNSASSDSLSKQGHDSDKSGKSSRQSSQVDLSEKRFFALYSYVAHRFHQKSSSSGEESGVGRGQSSTELSVSDFLQAEATTDGDFSLTIVSTNLSAEKETGLRKCLAHKISKGAVYSGTGSIIPLNLGLSEESTTFSCQMYFNLLRNSDQNGQESGYKGPNSREFLVCFLAPPEDGLDLFQKDLDTFSKGLLTHIDAECWESVKSASNTSSPQLTEINTGIRDYLDKWYEVAIGYVLDCVNTLQHAVKFLIYAAMTGSQLRVERADETTTTLCHRFVECCSLVELLHSSQPDKRDSSPVLVDLSDCDDTQPPASQQKTVLLTKGDNSYSCDITDLPKFAEDWSNALLGGDNPSAASLKRIIESYKLKCIQDLNFLTRLLRLAENDYYALYRAFVFLKHCGNGRILLSYTQLEQQVTDSPEGADVLNALEGFLQDTGVLTA